MKTKPQENKSVKTLKGQLFGAVAMMLVAAIALGTSTYAWFINNQTVEVETMDLQVSTSTSLLVKVGKQTSVNTANGDIANWTGVKSLVTNDDIKGTGAEEGGWTTFFSDPLSPASVTSANLLPSASEFYITNNHVTNGKLDEFYKMDFDPAKADSVGQGAVKRIPLTFVSSNDMNVYFGNTTLTSIADMVVTSTTAPSPAAGAPTLADQAAAIKAVLRLAVVPHNATKAGTDSALVFQFDAGGNIALVTTPGNNTEYTIVGTVTADETNGLYQAIDAVDTITPPATGAKITADGALNALVPGHATAATDANKSLATWNTSTGAYDAPAANAKPLFDLSANEERQVDVYFWLEGTDKDCLNELSSFYFGLNIPFASVLS